MPLDAVVADDELIVSRTAAAPGRLEAVADLDREDGSFHDAGFGGHHGFAREDVADMANTSAASAMSRPRSSRVSCRLAESNSICMLICYYAKGLRQFL